MRVQIPKEDTDALKSYLIEGSFSVEVNKLYTMRFINTWVEKHYPTYELAFTDLDETQDVFVLTLTPLLTIPESSLKQLNNDNS